jgi:hypothetical protein
MKSIFLTLILAAPLAVAQTPQSATGCASVYPEIITSLNGVYASLLQAQQIYDSAYANGGIDAKTYKSDSNYLIAIELSTQDARDIARLGGPTTAITKVVSGISTRIASVPKMLINVPMVASPLASLVATTQQNLAATTSLLNSTACKA